MVKFCAIIIYCSALGLGLVQLGDDGRRFVIAAGAARASIDPPPPLSLNVDGVGHGSPPGYFPCQIRDPYLCEPPDPAGDVGYDYYVQTVNESYAVVDKTSGQMLPGYPRLQNTLWEGMPGDNPCEFPGASDAVVRFDRFADRWIITQTVANFHGVAQCVAVSTSGNPTGSFYKYSFPNVGAIAKIGLWPDLDLARDAYYITYGRGNALPKVCALERDKLLRGDASARQICTDVPGVTDLSDNPNVLPSDLDGSTRPPVGAPNYLIGLGPRGLIGDERDTLAFWKVRVDWNSPTFNVAGPSYITVAPYRRLFAEYVPQPPPAGGLAPHGQEMMNRFVYRNFGTHESFLVSHAVDADPTAGVRGGVRWYELRSNAQDPEDIPTRYQEGTYSPDGHWRWMSSMAMDAAGNIGVGYSISSNTVNPGIRYTARARTDPLNALRAEGTIIDSGGYQESSRWGDYVTLNVDPKDECTFWYTNQYQPVTGKYNWRTRLAAFRLEPAGSLFCR